MATTQKVTPLIMVKNGSESTGGHQPLMVGEMRALLEGKRSQLEVDVDAIKRMEAKLNHPAFGFTQTQRDAVKAFIEEIR